MNTPQGLLGKSDAVGYAVCHRIDTRSFHLGDRQIPLCARCSGMYLGAMLGLVFQSAAGRRRSGVPPWRVLLVLGFFVLAFAVDGLNSYLHFFPGAPVLYEPHNRLRLLTGTWMGLVIAAALYPAFTQTFWREWDPRPALGGLRLTAGLIALALLLDIILLSENPLVLYPLALISAAGVVITLTMVYSMVWVMAFRVENHYSSIRQAVMPLCGGFGMALLQIAVLDVLRFWLTGTWEGFPLG